jgi:hypothetical protein
MRHYSACLALSFIVTVATVAAANFAIDAEGILRKPADLGDVVRAYVGRLIDRPNGLVLTGRERGIKLELARRTDADCLVTGSSHEMQLDLASAPQMFEGCRAVANLAVLSGSFEDFLAAIGVIAGRESLATVYVGVDPWTLRRRFNDRFAEERGAYEHARAVLGLKKDPAGRTEVAERYRLLVGGDYLLQNMRFMRRTGRFEIRDGGLARDDEMVIKADGIILESRKFSRKPSPAISTAISRLRAVLAAVDSEVASEFERALTYMVERHVGVKLLLMPYHPEVTSCAQGDVCEKLGDVETHARNLARRLGLEVIGSFDPRPFALTSQDFTDAGHLQMRALHKVGQVRHNPWTREGFAAGSPR